MTKFIRTFRPPETIKQLETFLRAKGYENRPLCDYEIFRIAYGPDIYMIYERVNLRQSWHPHLYEKLKEMEAAHAV